MGRRNDLDICAEILQIAKEGSKKTRIVYAANLNFKVVEKYLKRLMDNGLIVLEGRFFKTTKPGLKFVKDYNILVEPMIDEISTRVSEHEIRIASEY